MRAFVPRISIVAAFLFFYTISLCSIANAQPAAAAKAKQPKFPAGIVQIKAPDRKKIFCSAASTGAYSGTWSKKRFTPFQNKIPALVAKVAKAKKPKSIAKAQKKLNQELAKLAMYESSCKTAMNIVDPPPPPPPSPPEPPPPPPPAPPEPPAPDPLEEKTGPLSAADVNRLYEAALGEIPPDADALAQQGADALIDRMTALNDDSAAEAEALTNLYDGNGVITPLTIERWSNALLLYSKNPYYERFAFLFLHNLLTASIDAVADKSILYKQHIDLIRTYAVSGDYPELLRKMTIDPTMLYWLSGASNTKTQPNENYARELMELFTLGTTNLNGEPNYSEDDVTQVARALTGWTVTWSSGTGFQVGLVANKHDSDPNKVVFPQTAYEGHVEGANDIINHILTNHPGAPEYLSRRLLQDYFRADPPADIVRAIAVVLKQSNYNFHVALRKLFKSKAFYAAENKNTMTKNPVERNVEFMRRLGLHPQSWFFTENLISCGMHLGSPKTVFGWNYDEWNDGSLIRAEQDAMYKELMALQVANRYAAGTGYMQLLPSVNPTAEEVVNHWISRLGLNVTEEQRQAYIYYMTHELDLNGNPTGPAWNNGFDVVRVKIVGLLMLMSRSLDFQLK